MNSTTHSKHGAEAIWKVQKITQNLTTVCKEMPLVKDLAFTFLSHSSKGCVGRCCAVSFKQLMTLYDGGLNLL